MRARRITLVATLMVACALVAGFSSSSVARAATFAQTTTTTVDDGADDGADDGSGVEVEGKVVERAPEKDPVNVAEMARTGSDRAVLFGGIGFTLAGLGLVLLDVVAGPPARPRRTRAGLPRR